MKTYPSIPKDIQYGLNVYSFDKKDGSNIRAEFSKKKGFSKFGSRNRLLGTDQPIIHKAEQIIKDKYTKSFTKIAKKQNWERAILFFEFAGPNSFAGTHLENDEHDVWLFDVAPFKKGILPPKEFINLCGELQTAPLLYHGPCDSEFVASVKESRLDGLSEEGVVCKAAGKHAPIMFKIKTEKWLEKVRAYCNGDEKLFEKLV